MRNFSSQSRSDNYNTDNVCLNSNVITEQLISHWKPHVKMMTM